MRICISAGHGLRDPGVLNNSLKLREHVEAYRTVEREDLETVVQRAFGNRLSRLRCLGNISGYAPRLEIVRRDGRFETLMEDARFQWVQCEI